MQARPLYRCWGAARLSWACWRVEGLRRHLLAPHRPARAWRPTRPHRVSHHTLPPCACMPAPQIVNPRTGNVAAGCEIQLFAHDNTYLMQVPRPVPHM